MLTKLEIQNYKSICNATIELSPFTLLIGANGTGKSNLISLFRELSKEKFERVTSSQKKYSGIYSYPFQKHFKLLNEKQFFELNNSNSQRCVIRGQDVSSSDPNFNRLRSPLPELSNVVVFNINSSQAGKGESLVAHPVVKGDGSGVIQVLDALKTGDHEDLFLTIEKKLGKYIPEIEKLSFVSEQNSKKLQVRDSHLPTPILVEDLSEGTKLVLTILTILYQESPPSLICIEDIDRGIHPRLFQQIIELCIDLSKSRGLQIIATTHNPYILDEFSGKESAVVIVEKKEGCTTFTTLAERLAQFETNGEEEEMPLGSLWYSGLVGGVPKRY